MVLKQNLRLDQQEEDIIRGSTLEEEVEDNPQEEGQQEEEPEEEEREEQSNPVLSNLLPSSSLTALPPSTKGKQPPSMATPVSIPVPPPPPPPHPPALARHNPKTSMASNPITKQTYIKFRGGSDEEDDDY